jgi:hypothetical protein
VRMRGRVRSLEGIVKGKAYLKPILMCRRRIIAVAIARRLDGGTIAIETVLLRRVALVDGDELHRFDVVGGHVEECSC